MPLQQTLGDVRIPDRHGRRDHARGDTDVEHRGRHPRRTPAGEPQRRDQRDLHHHAAVEHLRSDRERRILWDRARRRIAEAERGIGEEGTRRGDRVTQQQAPRLQQWSADRQREQQAVAGREETKPQWATAACADHAGQR